MKHYCWTKCFVILFLAVAANSESYYSVNAPGVIKPNRKYTVVAALHDASGPCLMRVSVEGPNFKESKDINLMPFESQTIDFFPKKLESGRFFLKAEGLTGFIFKNQTSISADTFAGPKIYIQTDKAIYRPQDLVRFRFVVLDEHTRPLNIDDPIHVEILDAVDSRVKHFKNISLTHGTFSGKFQLSKYPRFGFWMIRVRIDGNYDFSESKYIKIRNDILPKFSVYLKTPSNFILADSNLKVAIYGKYTFDQHTSGKYVEGNATIELWNGAKTVFLQPRQVDIQNLGFVDFDLKAIQNIARFDEIAIKAYLTEKYTGNTQMEERSIPLRKQRYKLIVPDEEIEFENNKPYSMKVYVKHWTGAPVLDRKAAVTLKHGDKMYESFLDKTGAATFEFDYLPDADYNFQFKDSKTRFPNILTDDNLKLNSREFYCRLKLVDDKIKLEKPVLIEVSSIHNIPYLMYTVMGHASIIHMEHIQVPPNQKSHIISITPSIEMIPSSFVYVYYIHKGNLRYEEIYLKFPQELENQISLSAPKQAKPGEEVTISIKAQPKSYVGIMAVDLGVFLLDNTYDIYKDSILKELQFEFSYSPVGSAIYPGVLSGLATLTNGHYPFTQLNPSGGGGEGVDRDYNFREHFPETWIFDNYLINDTETKLTLQIPDSITTWRITAFSNNAVTGFGVVNGPTDITTIQTFFISLNLPYAVKRSEIVIIPVTIFNYSNQTLNTEVALLNTDREFYFMESRRQDVGNSTDEQQQKKRIGIAANKGKTVKFVIFPIKSGEINIRAVANSPLYSDAVLQKLKVEPEGVPKQQNQDLYLSIPEGEKISSTLEITDPVDSVPDSEYVTFSVGGHYLVPTVENFQELTQMPTGTGEQNMINFAPSVLILQYLKVNGKLLKEKDLVESLKEAIEIGYQSQLSYRYNDGGYSVFGLGTDEEPSSWLTAYVVRYFIKASEFVEIEASVIEKDLEYLDSQQTTDGEFLCTGCWLNEKHENEYGLTAFILLAFLEDPKYAGKYEETIKMAVEFLKANLNKVDDINALSLVATAIKRSKHQGADVLIDKINQLSKQHKGLRWWSAEDQNAANDIEITANAALTLLETPGDHTPILKWLIEQRNANGGFITSYDTIAGMEALVKFSEKYTNIDNVNLKVAYSAKDGQGNEIATDDFYVDSNNVLSFQKHELPRNARHVTFEMEGNGAALVQLNQQYNIDNVHEFRHFNIETKPMLITGNEYILKICFTYLADPDIENHITNAAIIEVNLPSGFRSKAENILALKKSGVVKKVEAKNSNSVVVLYLDKLTADMKYCVEIPLDKVNEVLMAKPAAIIMYDNYNITRSNTEFYSI